MYRVNSIVVLAITVCMLASCSSDDDPLPDTQTLIWRSCADDSMLECAELKVPTSYQIPDSPMIDIAINRLPSPNQPAKGSLLFNPGGPGGSGIELLEILADINTVPQAIRDEYDLIGFDPRGIGNSTAVDCDEFGVDDLIAYPTTRDLIEEFVEQATDVSSRCYQKYGSYLQQLGSLNVVRDMESIRKALKRDKLDFIGYSYGSRLAALYLQTYPETSGAMVLDGSVNPTSENLILAGGALPALQKNLESLLAQCTRLDSNCDPDQLLQTLTNRVNTLISEGKETEFELLGQLVLAGAQDPEFGDFLVAPLVSYLQQDDINILAGFLLTMQNQIGDDDEDSITAQFAVLCADDALRPTLDLLEMTLDEYNQSSDLFAEAYLTLGGSCAGWPESIEPLDPIMTRTAPQSLVIGGTTDAQTPLVWSALMADAIGGYFLTSTHRGHTSVFNERSSCVDQVVTTFLLEGELPVIDQCDVDDIEQASGAYR